MMGGGLGDENDGTAKGEATIRASDLVVLEMYTSILGVNTARLVRQWVAGDRTSLPPGWAGRAIRDSCA